MADVPAAGLCLGSSGGEGRAAGQVQRVKEGEGGQQNAWGLAVTAHTGFFCPQCSLLQACGPPSQRLPGLRRLSLYTDSCLFLLLFTARGARLGTSQLHLASVVGLKFAQLVWENKDSTAHEWEHPQGHRANS